MDIQQIEEKFAAIQGNSTYLRVSEDHPLELYLGLNDQGQKTLRFNGVFAPVKIVGNALLIIKQVRTSLGHSILFSFNSHENFTLFYKLCEDIIMSRIKGKNTKPEEIVRKYLFSKGFRYRKNDKRLPGTPDIVLPKYKTVIFVNGCFWHGHEGCKYFVWPKDNADFWKEKIESNIMRDIRKNKELVDRGWRVITIWECEIKHDKDATLNKLTEQIIGGANAD